MALLVVVVIAVALAMNTSSLWLPQMYPSVPVEPASSKSSPTGSANFLPNQTSEHLLRGRWLRSDGGYVIEVGNVQPKGRLEAAYFNPRPIKVSRAEWQRSNDELHVFVELRDVNYPGATYKLRYLPAADQLAGDYFQPLLSKRSASNSSVNKPPEPCQRLRSAIRWQMVERICVTGSQYDRDRVR